MNILLLGEYSGLHKFLKQGLLELGNNVYLAANGDGWKKIQGADGVLYGDSSHSFSRPYHRLVEPYITARKFKNFDVVQIINTKIYSHRINYNLINRIKKKNGVMSLLATGTDYRLYNAYLEKKLEYYYFSEELPKEYNLNTKYGQQWMRNDINVEKIVDMIIPTMYDYSVGYQNNIKTTDEMYLME